METKIKGIPELFGKSISIEDPWYIRSIKTVNDEVHVYVDVRDGAVAKGNQCLQQPRLLSKEVRAM